MEMELSSHIVTTNKPSPNFLQAACCSCHPTNTYTLIHNHQMLIIHDSVSPIVNNMNDTNHCFLTSSLFDEVYDVLLLSSP